MIETTQKTNIELYIAILLWFLFWQAEVYCTALKKTYVYVYFIPMTMSACHIIACHIIKNLINFFNHID